MGAKLTKEEFRQLFTQMYEEREYELMAKIVSHCLSVPSLQQAKDKVLIDWSEWESILESKLEYLRKFRLQSAYCLDDPDKINFIFDGGEDE